MQLTAQTLSVLKSFSSINPSFYHPGGKTVSTMSPTKTIIATAFLDQDIEQEFAVYDLSRFIGTLSLVKDPTIEIDSRYIQISGSGGETINYTRADPSNFLTPPKTGVKFPDEFVEFTLEDHVLSRLLKALGVLSLPEISISCTEGSVFLEAIDSKNPTGDVFRIRVADHEGEDFRLIIKAENLKILPGNYKVKLTQKGISRFSSFEEVDGIPVLEYFVAVESQKK